MQPEDCLAFIEEPPPQPPEPLPSSDLLAGWMLLGLLVAVIIIDIWLLMLDKNTLSQWLQRFSRGKAWFKALGVATLAILAWHVFWGFPWKLGKRE